MIKYITDYRESCVKFDTETQNLSVVKPIRTNIDWIYQADEDGEFTMDDVTTEVKKGDFIIKFYENKEAKTAPYAVIRSDVWTNNIDALNKYDEERGKRISCENCDTWDCGCNCEC